MLNRILIALAMIAVLAPAATSHAKRRVPPPAADPSKPNPVPQRPPPEVLPYKFDTNGWTLLGTQSVDGKRDRDVLKVKKSGKFDQLTLVVTDSDLELKELTLVFGNGQKWSPKVAHVFSEGARTRVIDLPGKDRKIARIELVYANIPGGGKASVELYARDVGRPAPPAITKIKWENKGWTFLGKTTADGWHDKDTLKVGNKGPYSELMFVVAGSDVELNGVLVTFGNGETFAMQGSATFKEGMRTKPIDLPGALRKLKTIEFAYGNLPGGGKAQVEVFARVKPAAKP